MLRQRVVTAVLFGIALLIVLLWLPTRIAIGVFALTVLIGAWEWSAMARLASTATRIAYVCVVALAMGLVWHLSVRDSQLEVLLWITVGWWLLAFLWVTLAPGRHARVTVAISGLLVLVPAWVAIVHLFLQAVRGIDAPGSQLVLFLLLLVWAADIGAFFAGRKFGRLKLAPRVSPAKTWEGVLGGVAAAAIVAAVGAWWFNLPRIAFLSLCLAVTLMSVVGDLTESMFKRFAGLKDSGAIFPGHGGVLDRIDSVTAAAPVFLLGLRWLELPT
jgi:phosphatidate cytidylyltransferase